MFINWKQFINYLSAETIKNGQNMTEGMLRYWFMGGIRFAVENLAIEESYFGEKIKSNSSMPQLHKPAKNAPCADLYFEENGRSYVIEFKYGIGNNRTEMFGEAFNDLNRLSVISNDEKYFIYIFDENMHKYCIGRLDDCFNVDCNKTTHIINPRRNANFVRWKNAKNFPQSFIDKAFHSFNRLINFSSFDYQIDKIVCEKIPCSSLYIAIYKVS